MPRPRRKVPSPEPAEDQGDDVQQDFEINDAAQPLQFNEPLTWRPGKPIAIPELLRRLKDLSDELATIEQEDAHRQTLAPKAQELAHAQLLGHKDKGVKAYTMVCIVEMFRLLAPNAPYTPGQLKEIFALFTSTIVPALANPGDPYNQQNNMVLTSLTTVKSVVLITDIPGAENLLLGLFTNCFDVLAGGGKNGGGERLPKNLEYHMTSMMCTLIDEADVLPTAVVDIILAQFLRVDPSAMAAGNKRADSAAPAVLELPPAYNMARAVCNTCSEKLERAIGQYFNSVLLDVSESLRSARDGKTRGKKRTHDESEDVSEDGLPAPPVETDLREIEKAHRLLRELWRSCPDVIQNVVPQVESEIQAESAVIRTLAVQTVGDMISGIGAAGPPPPSVLDPAAYPSQSLDDTTFQRQESPSLVPNAPHAFSSVYSSTYTAFIDRHKDKAPSVRGAWVTSAGRIILTSGGGKGLDVDQEKILLAHFTTMLVDSDEKVRLAAVNAIAQFDFLSIVHKIGRAGSVATPGSVLCQLADRIKDRKPSVRNAATELLARIWGVAAGAIAEGNERIRTLLGAIPSRILNAWYVNEREVHTLVFRVLFDYLLPIAYPPIKSKQPGVNGSQRVNDSQPSVDSTPDPDSIRAERILVLVRDLDDKAKTVFFGQQIKRMQYERHIAMFLELCEEAYGSTGGEAKEAKKKLDTYTNGMARGLTVVPDPVVAVEHLKKFAKHYDRRSYQLIRFCYSAESDYRKISKAMKEFTKRLEDAPSGVPETLETLVPVVRSTAVLVYNKSHVPAIVAHSRTDEKGLGAAAHEVLKEISSRAPGIFKVHVHEICETLKNQQPTSAAPLEESVVDTLKACAGFARKFPKDMPKDRDFYQAMVEYSIRSTPAKAAKHAVTVTVSSAEKKEMYAHEIGEACIQGFEYGEEGFLAKLASISQLRLLASQECEDQSEVIIEIAIGQILGQVRQAAETGERDWVDEIDDDLGAKLWALRILVNGLRGYDPSSADDPAKALKEVADPVYKLLNTLVQNDGELSKSSSTPKTQKAHLRLAAATHLLKLSCNRTFDSLLPASDLHQLSRIAQDENAQVRAGFAKALRKYLGTRQLSNRFYPLLFLYAFEPEKSTREQTITWLKSRAATSAGDQHQVMENAFPRFVSLLAHHQDFSTETEHLEDFVEYIMFYLKTIATETNLPLIYHFAQRLKTVQDGIDATKSENLYILADIAEAVIRMFQEQHGWSLQVLSVRMGMPSGLFAKLPSHTVAQEIADKRFVPDDLAEELEDLVKNSLKTKKRKAEGTSASSAKRPKHASNGVSGSARLPSTAKRVSKTPKPRKVSEGHSPAGERRASARRSTTTTKNYREEDDSDDDEELEQWQGGSEADANKENEGGDGDAGREASESTPPTSDPPVAAAEPEERAQSSGGKKSRGKQSEVAVKKAATARSTRNTRAREKDVMDVPSDSE